jgi:arylsulfatase A-like enzyme
MGDWKLIRSLEDKTVQLFNLKDDPGELQNRATEMSDKVTELTALLDSFLEETDAAMLKPKEETKPRDATVPKGPLPVKTL